MGADASSPKSSMWGFQHSPLLSTTTIFIVQLLLLLATGQLAECWRPSNLPGSGGVSASGAPVAGGPSSVNLPSAGWMHRMRLDANYDVYWTVTDSEVTFEVQVRTLGYVMFGLSPSGHFHDADLIVGWIHNGRPRFQVGNGITLFSFYFPSLLFF